jgi:hypothetical protein
MRDEHQRTAQQARRVPSSGAGAQLELAADYRFDSIVGGDVHAAVSEFGEERA